MAAGDSLFTLTPMARSGPASSAAALDVIAGTSTPAESVPVLAFDASADEHADFKVILPYTYAGGGLTFRIAWTSMTSTASNVIWGIAIRAFPDDAEDLDSTAHTYDYNEATAAAPSATCETVYDSIAFTNGADMDSWAAGDEAIIRIRRNGDDASDTLTGDAAIVSILCRETP
jgi:hypothetical protein